METTTSGTVTCGGSFEAFIFTLVPCGSGVFGAGLCEVTGSLGGVHSAYEGFGLNPAALSFAVASWTLSPTTLGTAAVCGPLETFTRTFDPFGTDCPAAGSVAVTTSAVLPGTMYFTGFSPAFTRSACAFVHGSPLTAGTVTFGGPVETQIVTVPPLSTFVPGLGFCLKTIPLLNLSFRPLFTLGWRPALLICCPAFFAGSVPHVVARTRGGQP